MLPFSSQKSAQGGNQKRTWSDKQMIGLERGGSGGIDIVLRFHATVALIVL